MQFCVGAILRFPLQIYTLCLELGQWNNYGIDCYTVQKIIKVSVSSIIYELRYTLSLTENIDLKAKTYFVRLYN